ncbi:hypothetical protein EJB05_13558, partial [Eragrostis curvula]
MPVTSSSNRSTIGKKVEGSALLLRCSKVSVQGRRPPSSSFIKHIQNNACIERGNGMGQSNTRT